MLKACQVGSKGLGVVIALGILICHTQTSSAQVFRGPNVTPPVVVLPPRQVTPLLNNGSLYTMVNPTPNSTWPNQMQFAFIAVAPQDCRLYHNGATIMPEHRLMGSLCLDSRIMPQQINATQGFIPQLPNGGLINMGAGGGNGGGAAGGNVGNNVGGGPGQGLFLTRPFTPSYYSPYPNYYGNGFDNQRGYGGMDFPTAGANLQAVAGNNLLPPGGPANLNNAMPPNANGFLGLGNFGGNNNPFAIFNNKKDEDGDKDKKDAKDETKDADKKDAKDEDKKNVKEEKKTPPK
jgi:hypothetical protein